MMEKIFSQDGSNEKFGSDFFIGTPRLFKVLYGRILYGGLPSPAYGQRGREALRELPFRALQLQISEASGGSSPQLLPLLPCFYLLLFFFLFIYKGLFFLQKKIY